MCGIFATYSANHAVSLSVAESAANRLAHRGPDGSGSWCDDEQSIALSHRQLSLVGIDNGAQPIFNEDRSIVAVVNGEFYGHESIRRDLKLGGHKFELDADSEIAVHLYEEYGLDFVQHLRGEFAILLWDIPRQTLLAVRDRFGIKPLVYSKCDDKIYFASEAKAILPLVSSSLDIESFLFATSLQYLPQERTIFEGIHQVPPGKLLKITNRCFETVTYWDLNYPNKSTDHALAESKPDHVHETRELLENAVTDRFQGEAPICFHLSGGIDSSSILGIASDKFGPQDAFTMTFEDSNYDESSIAYDTAKFCNARLHKVQLSSKAMIENLMLAAQASEGLSINGHLSAKYLMNRQIREHGFKAAITGEGADEAFLGYAHLKMDMFDMTSSSSSANSILKSNQSSTGMMIPFGDSLSLVGLQKQLGFVPTFLAAKATMGFRIRTLVNPDLISKWNSRDPFVELVENVDAKQQLGNRSLVHQSCWLWTKHALAGYILRTLGDGTEMPNSIEGRLPFLDHHLFERCAQVPAADHFDQLTEKAILREAVRPYVTERVYNREKHPFDSPPLLTQNSMQSREFLWDNLNGPEFRDQPIFDKSATQRLLERIPNFSEVEKVVWDPILILLMTTLANQRTVKTIT